MSFFKKLTADFKELKASFDNEDEKKKDKSPPPDSNRHDTHGVEYGGASRQHQPQDAYYANNHDHQQQLHGQQHHPYSADPYQAPSPQYTGLTGQPPLLEGWKVQFDPNSQRWYYVEVATGLTQWDPPVQQHSYGAPPSRLGYASPLPQSGYASPSPQRCYSDQRGHGEASGFYSQYEGAVPALNSQSNSQQGQNASRYYDDAATREKTKMNRSSDKTNMLMAGGAGLAVGGIAGALIAGDSDSGGDENHHSAPSGYGSVYSGGYNTSLPPAHDSDTESLRQAQQDYNEAIEAAADSDASSDELEELQEAREELEEEQEHYYED